MSTEVDFEQAQKDVETLSRRPSNDDLLGLYAHFKQASQGDVAGKRPGFTDLKGRAKYDAWAKLKGMDADTAKRAYVNKVAQLLESDRG